MNRKPYRRHQQDFASEELVIARMAKDSYEFSDLSASVQQALRARHVSGGGEEMLRLRVDEKLHTFVGQGLVNKSGNTGLRFCIRNNCSYGQPSKGR